MIGKKVMVGFTSIYTHHKSDTLPLSSKRQSIYFRCFARRQKETTTLINQSKNDYIIALKGNQKNLLKHAVKITENQPPRSQAQSVDIRHGRNIVRKVSVFDIPPMVSQGKSISIRLDTRTQKNLM